MYYRTDLNLSALAITETELKLIARAAIIGDNSIPNAGYNNPAAMGMPKLLYTNAKNKFCLIFCITFLLILNEDIIPFKLPLTKVISALFIAISVPVPIAIPTFDCIRAGASLMPSPAIATMAPFSCNCFM